MSTAWFFRQAPVATSEPPPQGAWELSVQEVQQPGGAPSSAIVGLFTGNGTLANADPNALGYMSAAMQTAAYGTHAGTLASAGFDQFFTTNTARRNGWGTLPDDYFRETGLTISALYRRTATPAANLGIIEWIFSDGEAYRVRFSSTSSVRVAVITTGNNVTSPAVNINDIPLGNDSEWHHVVMTHGTDRVTSFYCDGIFYASVGLTSPPDMHSVTTNARRGWAIGGIYSSDTLNRSGDADHVSFLRGTFPPTPA